MELLMKLAPWIAVFLFIAWIASMGSDGTLEAFFSDKVASLATSDSGLPDTVGGVDPVSAFYDGDFTDVITD